MSSSQVAAAILVTGHEAFHVGRDAVEPQALQEHAVAGGHEYNADIAESRLGYPFKDRTPAARQRSTPPIAGRRGSLTPMVYPMVHASRPLRSHLMGRLGKPA